MKRHINQRTQKLKQRFNLHHLKVVMMTDFIRIVSNNPSTSFIYGGYKD